MSEGPTREEEMLARLAELDLLAVEKAHAKLMAAEEASEINDLGRTYQRLARSLRQTIAIKAKLAREREADEAARPPRRPEVLPHEAMRPLGPKARNRIDQTVKGVARYMERERPDWDEFDEIELYDVVIDLAYETEDFETASIPTLVARVLEIMGAPPMDAAHDTPDRPGPAVHDSA